MARPEYRWRQLTPRQRKELLNWRKERGFPWHSPPHRANFGRQRYHITAACYEHRPLIGSEPDRMESFTRDLLEVLSQDDVRAFAWCILPNHYHALVLAPDIQSLLLRLGQFHGRTAYRWNGEENARGRKVFYRSVERAMRSDRHFRTTLNYVHHNPVHHGYVDRWTDWPWSSAVEYLEMTSPDEARRMWRAHPLKDYGKGWDDPEI